MKIVKSLGVSVVLGLLASACAAQVGDAENVDSSEQAQTTANFAWLAPVAGASVPAQSNVTLAWTGGDPTWNVNLSIADVAAWQTVGIVASNVPNTGTRSWTLPSSLVCGRNYLFYVENTQRTTWTYGPTFKITCSSSGVIAIPTPASLGACQNAYPVSGLHYPTQTCAQSQPNFTAGAMTAYHFTSKCPTGTKLLGVLNATCQNAPIPGFSTGSVYGATACCGVQLSPYYTVRDGYNAIWTVAQVQTYARNRANSECQTKFGAASIAQDVFVTNVTWTSNPAGTWDDRKFNCIIP